MKRDRIKLSLIKGIDRSALINPAMSKLEFAALKKSIKKVGLKVPIIIHQHLIVDGVHRFKACRLLGHKEIDVEIMPDNSSMTDKESKVKIMEIRRMKTETQVACMSVLRLKDRPMNIKRAVFARVHGTNTRNLSNAIWLHKNDKRVFDTLLEGNSIDIGTNNTRRLSNLLSPVVKFLEVDKTVKTFGSYSDHIENRIKNNIDFYIGCIVKELKSSGLSTFDMYSLVKERLDNHLSK
jgi:hypothetical protein